MSSKKICAVALLKESGPGGIYRSLCPLKGSTSPFLVWGRLLNALHGALLVDFHFSLAIDYNGTLQETWGRKPPDMLLTSTADKSASVVKTSMGGIFLFMQLERPDYFLLSAGPLHMLILHPHYFLLTSPDSHYILGQYYFPLEPMLNHIPLILYELSSFLQDILNSL